MDSRANRGISSSMTDDDRFPYWRQNRVVMGMSAFLCALGFHLSWPFLPLMVRSLGVQEGLETWVGNMLLIFYIVGFIANPLWGGLADHFGRKPMVLRATLGMGACMLAIPFAWSPLSFAVLLTIAGIFNGNIPAGNSLLVANTPPARIGTALSLAHSCNLLGRTIGPVASVAIAAFLMGVHAMFWISGALWILAGTLALFWVHEVNRPADGAWRPKWIGDLGDLLRVPRMPTLLLLSAVGAMLQAGNVTILSIFVVNIMAAQPPEYGTEAFWVGAVAMGLGIASLVAMPIWSRILDQKGPRPVLVFAVAMAVVTHIPLLFLQTPIQLVLARAAFGLTTAAFLPALTWLLREYAPKGMDARAIAYSTSFQFIAMGLAPFFAGIIGPALGLRTYFGFTIVLTLAGLVMLLRSTSPSGPNSS